MTKKHDEKTANADLIEGKITIGKWKIPPLSLKSVILLEKIKSPFVEKRMPECRKCKAQFEDDRSMDDIRDNVPIECPKCGSKYVPTVSVTELAEAMFVLIHQNDADIGSTVADGKQFGAEVLKMAGEITMQEMTKMTATISTAMTEVNALAEGASDKGGGSEKNVESGLSG